MTTTKSKLLKVGDILTVWPIVNRGCGESRDTEPGCQPWQARYLGTTAEGKIVVQDIDGRYPEREVNAATFMKATH